jgi:hypothetical protein
MRDREALRRNGRMNQIDLSFIRPFNSVPNKGAPMVGSRSVATIVNLLTAHLLRAIAIRTAAGILTDIAAFVAREGHCQRHGDGPFRRPCAGSHLRPGRLTFCFIQRDCRPIELADPLAKFIESWN